MLKNSRKNEQLTSTMATNARPRRIWEGIESFFMIRIRASEKETIVNVMTDPASINEITSGFR